MVDRKVIQLFNGNRNYELTFWHTGVDAVGKSIYSYTQNGVIKGAGYMNMTPAEMVIKYGLK